MQMTNKHENADNKRHSPTKQANTNTRVQVLMDLTVSVHEFTTEASVDMPKIRVAISFSSEFEKRRPPLFVVVSRCFKTFLSDIALARAFVAGTLSLKTH